MHAAEVVEGLRHVQAVRAVRGLHELQGALEVRLRLAIIAARLLEQREVVERDGHGRMIRAQGLLADL